MSEKELGKLLQQAHDELEDTEELSKEDTVLLTDLMSDIRARLGDQADEEHGLGDRLSDAVEQFNVSHPTVAFTLRRIIDALEKMGI